MSTSSIAWLDGGPVSKQVVININLFSFLLNLKSEVLLFKTNQNYKKIEFLSCALKRQEKNIHILKLKSKYKKKKSVFENETSMAWTILCIV